MNRARKWSLAGALLLGTASLGIAEQRQPVPRPFPKPTSNVQQPPTQLPNTADPKLPKDSLIAELGVTIYPNADYLDSYDAGRGQTFYLFGTNATFQEMVRYYSVILDDRGDRVFDAPATHQFDTERFRDEQMNYRPSVTIKDYTWNGAPGYLNPTPGVKPGRYQTIIQIATAPEDEANR